MDDDKDDKRGGEGRSSGDRPRGKGRPESGPRKDAGERKPHAGKRDFAGRKPREGDRPSGDRPNRAAGPGGKPFRPRPAAAEAGDGRPKRAYGGDRAPAPGGDGERPKKPYAKRRDDDRGAGGDRGAAGAKRPFRPRPEGGERPQGERTFRPRKTGEAEGGDARPKRAFSRDGAPGGAGERPKKPFVKRRDDDRGSPGGDRGGDPGKRPYRPRPEGVDDRARGERGFRARPEGAEGGTSRRDDRPRSGQRPDQAVKSFGDRPRRDDRADGAPRPPRDRPDRGDRPRGDRPERGDRPPRDGKPGFRDRAAQGGEGPRRPARSAATAETPETGERIAKRLARAGVASRRDAEALIEDGRVRLNGKVLTSPAINVTASDTITIDGQPIPAIERTRLFLFHKPAGLVTTNRDPEGRPTVFDALPADLPRLITIGRLDINTEGLLLLTNDGGLSRLLELPSTGWLRRYRVRVHGHVDEKALADLRDGVAVDGVFYGAIEATLDREQGSNAWLTIGLREGKNREVKNVLASLGLDVTRLIRISYGPFQLGELPEGAVQEIKGRMLREQLGDRLIEEAGANFDAPIVTPFSNKPTAGTLPREETRPARREPAEPGEGGLIKNRKRDRENRREDALGRLQTSRPAFGGKKRDKEEKVYQPPRGRGANVWMAKGARPQGRKKDEEGEAEASAPKRAPRTASAQRRPGEGGRSARPSGSPGGPRSGPGGGKGPRKPRRDG
jgi:23S rRNA pseudouridine2605 synthase